jgi:hypothetical protein
MGTISKFIAALLALIAGPLGLPITILMILWAITDITIFLKLHI